MKQEKKKKGRPKKAKPTSVKLAIQDGTLGSNSEVMKNG